MTVAMLLENTVHSAEQFFKGFKKETDYLVLDLKTPVPSDIEIASNQLPKPIQLVAEEIGLNPSEVILNYKKDDILV